MKRKVKVNRRDLRLFNQNKTHLMLQNSRESKKESDNSNAEQEICFTTCPTKPPKNSIENLGNRNLVKPIQYTPRSFSLIASDTSVRYPAVLTNNEDTVFEELDGAISEKEMIDLKGTNEMG